MTSNEWEEVSLAEDNKRRELVLKGNEIAARISSGGIDLRIFTLTPLNFLEISDARLTELPSEIGNLTNMINLILRGNHLTSLPETLGNLKSLQFFDASVNKLTELPKSLGEIESLHTFDFSQNNLTELPESFNNLKNLACVNVSRNNISNLDVLFGSNLVHLSEVLASHNTVNTMSPDVSQREVLRTLDLSDNKLQAFPASLAQCSKLKELFLSENPIKDRRLWKLVQPSRGQGTKATLEYIHTHGIKSQPEATGKGKEKKVKRKKKPSQSKDEEEDLVKRVIEVLSVKDLEEPFEVITCKSVVFVRPYIACCIVRNLDLVSGNRFKQFITAQTKLHDGPLCSKRTVATIATHDLRHIKGPLKYEGRKPSEIELTPLGKKKSTTADVLMAQLNKEADDLRKEMKRNTVSGIHKYLSLLAGQEVYPCLMDAGGHVISFPPITNADVSKISKSTTDILIEVTSSEDVASCKKVLEALLSKMLELNLGNNGTPIGEAGSEANAGDAVGQRLTVQQVRVVNEDGDLRVVYPSRTDLNLEGINVIR